MALTYGNTSIPSDRYTVEAGGTIQIAAAFDRSVGLVGGMDTSNGTATEGEVVEVNSVPEAATLFGDGSELHRQVELAYLEGATDVYALPVPETSTTESFASTSSGTLSNVPFFNPEIQPEHTIDVQDTTEGVSVTVNVVYTDGAPSAPTSSNTVNLDYITGQWTADASSSYDFTYTYGDYSDAVLSKMEKKEPRVFNVLTEHESTLSTLATNLEGKAKDFSFMLGLGGIAPFETPDNPDTSGYTDSLDSERLSVVLPYGYYDAQETEMIRTTGQVAGRLASIPLGVSSTQSELSDEGLQSLRTDLTPSEAGELIDAQVMPLIDYPPVTIIKDMTTSTTQKFERVYAMQVIDEAIEVSHRINRNNFIGGQATDDAIAQLERAHKNTYKGFTQETPALLSDYAVDASRDSQNNNEVNLSIGLEVTPVMDVIDVTMTVGEVVRNVEVT